MNNRIEKKEIYFSKDVFRNVAKKHGVSEKIIEKAFNSFIQSFKTNIEETDDILYPLPYLGEMMITEGDARREYNKFKKRASREKNKIEKERLSRISKNYLIRIKKIRIEVEKMKRVRISQVPGGARKMWSRKYGMTEPENIKRKNLLMGSTLDEAIKRQNDYAYKYYEKNNLPVTL